MRRPVAPHKKKIIQAINSIALPWSKDMEGFVN